MFIYFSGIRTQHGEYVVEVSDTADGHRRIMTVPTVFYMKFPLEMLNRTLDTSRNRRLSAEFDARKDVRLVKTMRNQLGQKLLSSEAVTLDTNWHVMIDRNILVRSSTYDNHGIQRYLPAGASYETLSMICPLSSQLVGFATRVGKPAMIFMTAQDEAAKRPEDKEHDSIMQLHDEAKAKYYDLDLDLNLAETHSCFDEIQTIFKHVHRLTESFQNGTQEEKVDASSSGQIFSELQRNHTTKKNEAMNLVNLAKIPLRILRAQLEHAEESEKRIDTIVKSIHAWAKEKALSKQTVAAERLIKEGDISVWQDVVIAGLPVEGDLGTVMRDTTDLQREVELINSGIEEETAALRNALPRITSDTTVAATSSTAVPAAATASTSVSMEIERTPSVSVPVVETTMSLSPPEQTPAQIPSLELPQWLQHLTQKMQNISDEAIDINARVTAIKPNASEKLATITSIVNTIKSARVQRNKDIVNWPAARDLIAETKKSYFPGYVQWQWYHTNFPDLFVNYLFDLLMQSGKWSDIAFTALNTIASTQPLPTQPIPTKQVVRDNYESMLTKLASKTDRIPLPADFKGLISQFIFGRPKLQDQFTWFSPVAQRNYKTKEAALAQVELAKRQLAKVSELTATLTSQLNAAKEKMQSTAMKIKECEQLPDSEEKMTLVMGLHREVFKLDLRIDRLQGSAKKALATYEMAEKLFNEKNGTQSTELQSMDVEQEEKTVAPAVILTKAEAKAKVEQAVQAEKQVNIRNGLVTSIAIGKQDRFNELYPDATSETIAAVHAKCKNKPKLLKNFNDWVKAIEEAIEQQQKRVKLSR